MNEPSTNNSSQPANRPLGRPRLDAAFPSLRLLGFGVFLVVLGLVFSGWNIVHLDRQRAELASRQADLARERAAFDERLAEMPGLLRQHTELEAATATLARDRKIVAEEVERLERQRQEVQKILEESQSGYHLAQSAREEARRELTEIMAEINTARPMLIMIEARLAVLKAREYSLREDLDQGRTERSQLAAEVKGLEREREHALNLLDKIASDNESLQVFSEAVKAGARDLGQAAKEAEAAARKFAAVTSDLGDSTGSLKTGATDIAEGIKNLEAQATALKALAAPLQNQARDFTMTTKMLQEEADKGRESGQDLRRQLDELRQSVEAARELMQTVSAGLAETRRPEQ